MDNQTLKEPPLRITTTYIFLRNFLINVNSKVKMFSHKYEPHVVEVDYAKISTEIHINVKPRIL